MPAIQRDVNSIIKHKAAVSAPASSLSAVSFNHNFCDRTGFKKFQFSLIFSRSEMLTQ